MNWKGELGDGEVHMTAHDYVEHKVAEDHEQKRMQLRKIANNPILSKEAAEAVRYAVYILDDNIWLRNRIMELQEQIENMKARNRT